MDKLTVSCRSWSGQTGVGELDTILRQGESITEGELLWPVSSANVTARWWIVRGAKERAGYPISAIA
ncbi:hypothetical protein [Nocardia sp. NPDC060249]|uniref:hypothetical protein n=1 Tax=Nocardia sp. NPDC060249 TaxID=3347082 RepID=UPI00364DBC6E